MRSRPCTIEDIRRVELQEAQLHEDPRVLLPENLNDDEINAILAPVARTLEDRGEILACFGLVIRWPGLAEVWALYTERILQQPRTLIQSTRYWLEWAEQTFAIRRFQATAAERHAAAHRWLLHLGFVPEGRLPSYGIQGETHILYGRVK